MTISTLLNKMYIVSFLKRGSMAIVVKWLTRRIVAPVFVGSIPISRPRLGYGQVVKAPDFDSEIEGSNPSSPAIAGVAELADALDLGSSS